MAVPGGGIASTLPTAGAVPIQNEKGQISMQKVRVSRYVAGKRPEFASSDSDSESEMTFRKPQEFSSTQRGARQVKEEPLGSEDEDEGGSADIERDPRFRRIQEHKQKASPVDEERTARHRQVREPEILREESSSSSEEEETVQRHDRVAPRAADQSSDDADDDEGSDGEAESRRMMLRRKLQERNREELLAQQQVEDAGASGEESESTESEYEEYTDSEDDEDAEPRLKPVFVRKRDRITLQETQKEEQRLKELQLEQKKISDDRKRQSVKMVEDLVRREVEMEKNAKEEKLNLEAVNTDDENEELAYEQWKVRELKRIKRNKDELEAMEKERMEIERVHNMTEEERRAYARANPKLVTNKALKGKYKFLQKYYHRGAFFLDKQDEVYVRDFAQPTLEDHHDKTVLPKVMQVKNFGLAGRTKYTHLVDQDTADFSSPWFTETAQNMKFVNKHAAGMRDVFEKPSAAKKRKK